MSDPHLDAVKPYLCVSISRASVNKYHYSKQSTVQFVVDLSNPCNLICFMMASALLQHFAAGTEVCLIALSKIHLKSLKIKHWDGL